eukprot:TRINITY_DN5453_c0_g1_i15.p1 TRINITY_DN5453_c0_g1~~TRINITY_DN5453_c0_g1_i15.p1  ORF type:complete len:272 (-),score=46.41 TRINITY_DN5453_c0_g1_i15:183-998(-)
MGVETASQLYIASEQRLVAPEIVNGHLPSVESDVWELGATIKYLVGTSKVSDELNDLLGRMMNTNERERITILDALTHRWFNNDSNEINSIAADYTLKSQVKTHKEILNLINTMASRGKDLNVNELRLFMQSIDAEGTGEISFLLFMNYALEKDSAVLNEIKSTEFIVNYNDILSSCMALIQFIRQERRAELFAKLSKRGPTMSKEATQRLLEAIGQVAYVATEEDFESFIQGHQVHPRAECDLTYGEFMRVANYLDIEVIEDLLVEDSLL